VATVLLHATDPAEPARSMTEHAEDILPGAPESGRTPVADADPASQPAPKPLVLFLDDDPARAELFLARYPAAVWVQTARDCIDRLSEGWDQVHLDHDLGGERFVDPSRSDCGMEVVRWLCAEFRGQLRDTQFIIHSHNVEAAEMMVWGLYEAGYHAAYRPFAIDLVDWLSLEEPKTPGPPPAARGNRKWSCCLEWLRRLSRALRAPAWF
jgi:hypothetical protein